MTIAVARPISPAASLISQAVLDRRFDVLPFEAQECLHRLSLHAIQKRWAYEFHSNNGLRVAPAVISYEFPVPKPEAVPATSGESTLWGYLYKAGGSPPGARLRLRDGKLFTAKVTDEIITQIQADKLIYTDIGLIGVATWRLQDWSLASFKATELANYRSEEVSPAETFWRLREAAEGRWDDIDPVDFVNELRFGGE